MTNNLRIKIIIGSLLMLSVAVFIFWSQQRSATVVLGKIQDTGELPVLDQAYEHDENAPLVLNESGEMVPARKPQLTGVTFDTIYSCSDKDDFETKYDIGANAIILVISDDESYVLPQAVTTVGARYAKWDESVIFYEEAGEAFVTIDDVLVREGCVGRESS